MQKEKVSKKTLSRTIVGHYLQLMTKYNWSKNLLKISIKTLKLTLKIKQILKNKIKKQK